MDRDQKEITDTERLNFIEENMEKIVIGVKRVITHEVLPSGLKAWHLRINEKPPILIGPCQSFRDCIDEALLGRKAELPMKEAEIVEALTEPALMLEDKK